MLVLVGACFNPSAPETSSSEETLDAGTQTMGTTPVECEEGTQEVCWESPDGTMFPGRSGTPEGDCRFGERQCSTEGVWGPCEGAVGPAEADSCDVAGADNNCNGVPNESCPCTGTETRPCGSSTGNCEPGTQTCSNEVWGACEGGVIAQALDACTIADDDANCNGVPNEGCPCVSGDAAESCGECATRTCDPANRAWGECIVQTSSCTIEGVCYGHNAANPDNPCQYCDAVLNPTTWTNSSNSTGCDDGLFCNGADTCNGSGTCTHEYPNGTRCDGTTGPCAGASCNEQARSCVLPNTEVCEDETEYRCTPNGSCGAQIERRQVQQFCSGSSVGCDGPLSTGDWQPDDTCGDDEICTSTGTSASCNADVECVAFCDPETGLCWLDEVRQLNLTSAQTFCNAATSGGNNEWRLPTVDEWIGVLRGCDNGTRGDQTLESSCQMTPALCSPAGSCDAANQCTACADNQGPDTGDNGCYWEASLTGPCNDVLGYWTSTSFTGASERWVAHPRSGRVFGFGVPGSSLNIKCVTQL